MKKHEMLSLAILNRMAEIDCNLTTSAYLPAKVVACCGAARLERPDEPPTGDSYNLLWDAILDEIRAVLPDLDIGAVLQAEE
jgi:hypothetical protein